MKKLLVMAILSMNLLSAGEIDYKNKYAEQVFANKQLVEEIQKQDIIILTQKQEIEIQKIKERERMIIAIPFTEDRKSVV
jgi:hypothetical protein